MIYQVVNNGPSTFIALSLLSRLEELTKCDKEWVVLLDNLATALLDNHPDSGQPLLVVAAVHLDAHLLAKEVVARTHLMTSDTRARILCTLQNHVELLRGSWPGDGVLRALSNVVSY